VSLAISIGFFASNVTSSAQQIRTKYFEEVMIHVANTVQDISLAEEMSVVQTQNAHFNVTDEEQVKEYTGAAFFNTLKMLPIITGVYCGLGNYAGVSQICGYSRYEEDFNRMYYFANYKDKIDATGVFITDYDNYLVFEPQNYFHYNATPGPEPIYISLARNSQRSIWTPSYTSTTYKGVMFLTMSHPVRDANGEFMGFCAFDAATQTLNEYLYKQANQADSITVVVEKSTGHLIGTSDPSVELYEQTDSGTTTRFDGTQAKNKRMAAMLRYARDKYGGSTFTKVDNETIFDRFYFHSENNALNIGRISDSFGLDWIVIQSLPMKNFYTKFITSIIIMICVTLALLLISIVLSVFVAYSFMRPIYQLIQRAESIKMLQLDQVEKDLRGNLSFFSEIRSLQKSFRSMNLRLKQLRNFIPDHILVIIEAEFGARSITQDNTGISGNATGDETAKTTSDILSDTRTSSGGKNQSTELVNKALNSALTSGQVTVMSIRFSDLSQALESYSASDISDTTKELFSQLMDVIRVSKGQFVSVTSSEAIVVWNTYVAQMDHQTRGCKAAITCMESLKKLRLQWETNEMPILTVSIALASGTVHYGNLGSDHFKFYTLLGSAASRASKMSLINSKWNTTILCDEFIFDKVKEEYQMRPVDRLDDNNDQCVVLYELGEAYPSDAWVHELQPLSFWTKYIEAYNLYYKGHYDEAHDKFVEYLKLRSDDIPGQYYLERCKALCEGTLESDTTATVAD
jgi:class 3 adenylate cyclase